jgi:iron(III) transport system ATP-binding protein
VPTNVDLRTDSAGAPTHAAPADRREVVRVRGLAKQFRRAGGAIVPAIDDVSITVAEGEFVVLLGPSGCGKTTLLRSIAGLERPDAGEIDLHDRTVYSAERGVNLPPERRGVSMIFQSYALWPHMSAFDNIAYPLRSRRVSKAETAVRANRALEIVGIADLGRQYPSQLSGGQQQRVALARAIVANDNLVLFDEPLSNVDAKVREQLRLELLSMQREIGFAALYVTHDQIEAMELANRIAVMRLGKIAQLGAPRDVYERPATRYVANFLGTANEIPGRVETTGAAMEVQTNLGRAHAGAWADGVALGDECVLVFRPERCELSIEEPATANRWEGTVEAALFVGSHSEHIVRVGSQVFRVWRPSPELLSEGTRVWIGVDVGHLRAVPDDQAAEELAEIEDGGRGLP